MASRALIIEASRNAKKCEKKVAKLTEIYII